jgi:hypothetical protein
MKQGHTRSQGLPLLFIIALCLALLVPVLDAKERRGTQLVISKRDGVVVQGELLAVKEENLIIMDESTPGGVTVSLRDARLVKVVKQGKAGPILGFALLGGFVGGATGYAVGSGHDGFLSDIDKVAGGAIGAGIGIVAGGLVGIVAGSNKTFTIANADPASIRNVIDHLRPLARDRS